MIEPEIRYEETMETVEEYTPKKEPKALGILSLVFGILSIIIGGVVGIVFGSLARKFAGIVLSEFEATLCAKLAAAGKITGAVGLILSLLSLLLSAIVICVIAVIVWLLVDNGKLA